jgi:hypothetical protein
MNEENRMGKDAGKDKTYGIISGLGIVALIGALILLYAMIYLLDRAPDKKPFVEKGAFLTKNISVYDPGKDERMKATERFSQGFIVLKSLFKNMPFDTLLIKRIDDLFDEREKYWQQNLIRLKNYEVKYLLIAEAPRYAPVGRELRYFCKSFDNAWDKSTWKAFFPFEGIPGDEIAYCKLAERGFLLIDSLPFSMNYGKRETREYEQLVKSSFFYFTEKINDPNITWAKKGNYAFALKTNGRCIEKMLLPNGQEIIYLDKLWVGTNFGTLNSAEIKRVFGV